MNFLSFYGSLLYERRDSSVILDIETNLGGASKSGIE